MKLLNFCVGCILGICLLVATAQAAAAETYYVAPDGDDDRDGTSEAAAWATFDRAWEALYPGDTLLLMDGVYRQTLRPNKRNGLPEHPITVKAVHDGKAIVDGQGGEVAIQLGDTWPGPVGSWYVLEGIVARNAMDVIIIKGSDNVLRRISAYDADVDGNSSVITVAWTDHITIEDCIAAGTGRKMILVFGASDVTIRRCLAHWERWDGQDPSYCGVSWPSGNGIHLYGGGPNLRIENSISMGPVPGRSIATTNQSDTQEMTDIEILGSMALQAGANLDGTPFDYPTPATDGCDWKAPWSFYPGEINGFTIYGQGPTRNVTLRDVLAAGNGYVGFEIFRPTENSIGGQNVTLDHATLVGNATYGAYPHGAPVPQVVEDSELTITNSNIAGTAYQGEGARLTHRYVDGELTEEPLWPWPMEARALEELGFSMTDLAAQYLGQGSYQTTIAPEALLLHPGDEGAVTLTVAPVGNFSAPVTVTVSNPAPDEITITPASAVVQPPGTAVFTVKAAASASPDTPPAFTLEVATSSNGVERRTSLLVATQGTTFLPQVRTR